MSSVCFKVDEDVNFYYYLINLYGYEEDEVDWSFREEYSNLRSEKFYKLFGKLEDSFLEELLGVNKLDENFKKLIRSEREKFHTIWLGIKKSAESLRQELKTKEGNVEALLEKACNLTNIEFNYEDLIVYIVPILKHHGMQSEENFIFLSVKDDLEDLDDYVFVIFHELMHVLLYDFMNEYYFKYGYREKLHLVEEVLINLIYFKVVETEEKNVLPPWLYLTTGRHYETYCELIEFNELIEEDLNKFVEKSMKKLGIK